MTEFPPPPATYDRFTKRFPELATAWEQMAVCGKEGPLDVQTQRLVKLAVSIGALREGAVHSSVRKARSLGIEPEAIEQVVALCVSTMGMPSTVAAYTWVRDVLDEE